MFPFLISCHLTYTSILLIVYGEKWWGYYWSFVKFCRLFTWGEHESYGDGDNAGDNDNGDNGDDDDDCDDDVNHLANSAGSLSPGTWGRQQGA